MTLHLTLRRSWLASANTPDCDFALNNLPCGVFSDDLPPRCGMAIADMIPDVAALKVEGLLILADHPVFDVPFWNDCMELGPDGWADLRTQVTAMLVEGSTKQFVIEDHLLPLAKTTLHMPFPVLEYTDFSAGRHHAFNVGLMFRDPANAMPPNWLHIPIGYSGRASSVVVSGADVPAFAPSARFDFELGL